MLEVGGAAATSNERVLPGRRISGKVQGSPFPNSAKAFAVAVLDFAVLFLSAGRGGLASATTHPTMARNEAETRYELIDPILREKGYRLPYIRLETPAPVEPIGPKGRRRPGPGKIDYLLCVEVPHAPKPLPIAILEAKKEDEDPLKGMQQAKGYSDCQRFEAKYIFSTNGHRYAQFSKFNCRADWTLSFPGLSPPSTADRVLPPRHGHQAK